jgi:predicted transcriptional regulator
MKKIRSVRVSDSLWQKVKAKAKGEDKTVSEVITNALRDYVKP